MNTTLVTEDNLCRLAKALMVKHSIGYEDALEMIGRLRLHIVGEDSLRWSSALQAALLTAVNCGRRAFHGGVTVSMPASVASLLPWPKSACLNEIVTAVGGVIVEARATANEVLLLGADSSPASETDLRILASGWRGGVIPADELVQPPIGADFASGGVLAGGLGVAKAFLRASGICVRAAHFMSGASLWDPASYWLDPSGEGPELVYLPKELWLLGLGHLGQAAAWNLGLLPFADPSAVMIQLQDYDRAVHGNMSAGLLCEEKFVGRYKTRMVSDWFEARGFSTRITERAFDCLTQRQVNEPRAALCCFDNAEARQYVDEAGFDLVIECGLGGAIEDFDSILLHTFPDASKTPRTLWRDFADERRRASQSLVHKFEKTGECGILAEILAQKAISTSFVGACAGAWMLAELLRGLQGGARMEILSHQLRSDEGACGVKHREIYSHRLAPGGFVASGTARQRPTESFHAE